MKCGYCGADADLNICWLNGTKDKRPGRGGAYALRQPKVLCDDCLEHFPEYEVVRKVSSDGRSR